MDYRINVRPIAQPVKRGKIVMKKIIISPSYKIADYWCREMRIEKHEVKVITPDSPNGYRGINAENVYAYLFEETFDFPENTHPDFEKFCREVEQYTHNKNPI